MLELKAYSTTRKKHLTSILDQAELNFFYFPLF